MRERVTFKPVPEYAEYLKASASAGTKGLVTAWYCAVTGDGPPVQVNTREQAHYALVEIMGVYEGMFGIYDNTPLNKWVLISVHDLEFEEK
jgi:hypothetical protein